MTQVGRDDFFFHRLGNASVNVKLSACLSGLCDYGLPERSSPLLTLLPLLVPARPVLEYYENM